MVYHADTDGCSSNVLTEGRGGGGGIVGAYKCLYTRKTSAVEMFIPQMPLAVMGDGPVGVDPLAIAVIDTS